MVDLGENFESDEHTGPELLEEGEYSMILSDASLEENSKKTGHNLKLVFTIIEGGNEGRRLFANLCWTNPSQVAVQIAKQKFAELVKACGKETVRATEELMDIPIRGKVVIQESKNPSYADSNQIIEFSPLTGVSPVKQEKKSGRFKRK